MPVDQLEKCRRVTTCVPNVDALYFAPWRNFAVSLVDHIVDRVTDRLYTYRPVHVHDILLVNTNWVTE